MTAAELLPLIKAKGKGDRLSENLYKWVKSQMARRRGDFEITVSFTAHSQIDGSEVQYDPAKTQPAHIIISSLPTDDCTFGSRLSVIIGNGSKAEVWAYSNIGFSISPLDSDNWWQGYINGGKCWIDPEHRLYHDRERWQISEDGNTRSCLWCGGHSQRKHIEMCNAQAIDLTTHPTDTGGEGGEDEITGLLKLLLSARRQMHVVRLLLHS